MPRLWSETIESHRHDVRTAILDTTWALVTEHGLTSVTMSQVAQQVGIGRATLYKYFPDIEAILLAFHERHVADHLGCLRQLREQGRDPVERLEAVLAAYADIVYHRGRHAADLHAVLHPREHVDRVQQQLRDLFRELLAEAAQAGALRDDIPVDELARFCLHALSGAAESRTETAVRRLVDITLDALRTQRPAAE